MLYDIVFIGIIAAFFLNAVPVGLNIVAQLHIFRYALSSFNLSIKRRHRFTHRRWMPFVVDAFTLVFLISAFLYFYSLFLAHSFRNKRSGSRFRYFQTLNAFSLQLLSHLRLMFSIFPNFIFEHH